jgi:hypothetical protein
VPVATTMIETNVTAIRTGLASGWRPQAAEMASDHGASAVCR